MNKSLRILMAVAVASAPLVATSAPSFQASCKQIDGHRYRYMEIDKLAVDDNGWTDDPYDTPWEVSYKRGDTFVKVNDERYPVLSQNDGAIMFGATFSNMPANQYSFALSLELRKLVFTQVQLVDGTPTVMARANSFDCRMILGR